MPEFNFIGWRWDFSVFGDCPFVKRASSIRITPYSKDGTEAPGPGPSPGPDAAAPSNSDAATEPPGAATGPSGPLDATAAAPENAATIGAGAATETIASAATPSQTPGTLRLKKITTGIIKLN